MRRNYCSKLGSSHELDVASSLARSHQIWIASFTFLFGLISLKNTIMKLNKSKYMSPSQKQMGALLRVAIEMVLLLVKIPNANYALHNLFKIYIVRGILLSNHYPKEQCYVYSYWPLLSYISVSKNDIDHWRLYPLISRVVVWTPSSINFICRWSFT